MSFNYSKLPAGYYDKIYYKGSLIQRLWHYLKFYNFKKKIPNNHKVLDIGCGPGTFSSFFSSKKYFGIDIAENQIKYAKEKYPKKKFKVIKKKIPYPKNFFDTIVLIEIIEHLTNKEINNLLKNSNRVLKENGQILISTPNYNSFWPMLEYILNLISSVNYEEQHINKFTKKKLHLFLSKRKYRDIKISTILLISPFLFFLPKKCLKIISILENKLLGFGNLLFCKVKKN
jgi:2-polyprenyl-3-methyl-5-hydroxy-6-metoxy-1,4-benzoquinol methylase